MTHTADGSAKQFRHLFHHKKTYWPLNAAGFFCQKVPFFGIWSLKSLFPFFFSCKNKIHHSVATWSRRDGYFCQMKKHRRRRKSPASTSACDVSLSPPVGGKEGKLELGGGEQFFQRGKKHLVVSFPLLAIGATHCLDGQFQANTHPFF